MKIALLGDIGFFGKYTIKNQNIQKYFEDVSKILKKFDYVIGNLETPLCKTNKKYGPKSAHIKGEVENVELLKYLNISIVNLSNNHMFDYGKKGCDETIEILNKNNINYFGVNQKQILLNIMNNKIALSGYCCYSTNALGYYNQNIKAGIDVLFGEKMEKKMMENFKNGYLNIASVHCGQEHIHYPNYDHIKLARKIADKVQYIFYGHHPHVIQGIEKVNESLIAYSLGNFCFDDVYTNKSKEPLVKQTEENRKSFILSLEIENSKLKKYEIIPIFATEEKMEVFSQKILKEIKKYSEYLKLPKEIFENQRNQLLNNYLMDRKKKRNLKWYLKRLNLTSAKMIYNAKQNQKKYDISIKKYIDINN